MTTNDTFYRKSKNFVIESLEVLEEIKDREGIPLCPPQEEISIEEGGGFGTTSRFIQKPDFSYLIFKNWEKIKRLTEYEECKNCMCENEIIDKHLDKLVGTIEQMHRVDIDTTLQGFILKLISESASLKFNEKIFTECFDKLRNFFINDKLQFRTFALLEGFTADINEIQLDDNLRIFKIPTRKLEELLKNSTYMPVPHFRMLSLRFAIERIYETDKIVGEELGRPSDTPTQETMRIFDETISALRLFKPETVGYNFIQTEAVDWSLIGGGSIISGNFIYPYFGAYSLKKDEISDFKEIYKKLKNKQKFLDIPLRYFNYAHKREKTEDKLIDYMIAFESLFIKEKAELSYRLSLRVATFLGGDHEEKGRIFKLMRIAYGIRSEIVHGTDYNKNIKINEEKLSVEELTSKIEGLLSKSIKRTIETGQRPDQILENSPESIFI